MRWLKRGTGTVKKYGGGWCPFQFTGKGNENIIINNIGDDIGR